ncbi:hypothetical protein Tco_0218183 [Tanacetum coccineum]
MDAPPTPNHVFNYPEDDPTIDKEEFEEDPHEDPKEEPEEEEPEEAQHMDFDFGLWDEDEEEDEAKLIFLYEAEGSPYPPPPASPDVECEINIACHVSRAIREATRVENIRLGRELEDVEIRYTLMHMGKERVERDLHKMTD